MIKLENRVLEKLIGGTSSYITGSVINAFVNVIKLLTEAGSSVGSSIRRIAEGEVCPLR